VELSGARRALELGTFTGYSALCIAAALPADGRLIACDVNEEALAVARRYWRRAGVDGRIELRIGEVGDALAALAAAEPPEPFDFAFIDADKPGYPAYYEACLGLLRPGGLIVADNVLYGGAAAAAAPRHKYADAIRRFNARLAGDERVSLCMVPLGDGLTLARKRGRAAPRLPARKR